MVLVVFVVLFGCEIGDVEVFSINLVVELGIVVIVMEVMVFSKEVIEYIVGEYLVIFCNVFFLGRNIDYFVVMEVVFKLKEILYI